MNFTPGKVTPKSLKLIKEFKLDKLDRNEYTTSLVNVATDPVKLKTLCTTIFTDDFSKVNFEEMDLEYLHTGIVLFLAKLLTVSKP